jgi:hypothetical protein
MKSGATVVPPEAAVIQLARKATGMTADDAAAAVRTAGGKISATYWRDIERGRGGRRGEQVTARASDTILAHMAHAVGVTSGQLRNAGREDAALVLDEITRRESATPDPGLPPILQCAAAEPQFAPYFAAAKRDLATGTLTESDRALWENPAYKTDNQRLHAVAMVRMVIGEPLPSAAHAARRASPAP